MPRDISLVSVFQPIVNLMDGSVLGYEALGRLGGQEDDGFGPVLQWARETRRTTSMYRQLQKTAIDSASARPKGTSLFMNGRLADLPLLNNGHQPWSQMVLEVPESDRRLDEWGAALRELRLRGMQVAIDDWGVGMADPLRLIQLEPDWVKIDVALVRQIHHPQVARLVELLVRWVGSSTHVIAEGIETAAQLHDLRQLGVTYGQGFLLARPTRDWPTEIALPQALPHIANLQRAPLALGQANHLSEADLVLIQRSREELQPLFAAALTEFLGWLYTTIMGSRFDGLDRSHHERILLEHFDLLTRGTLDESDVERAGRIARVHQRFGIDLAYYVTGYRQIQAHIAKTLRNGGRSALADALRLLFDWDISLVLQAYQEMLNRDSLTGTLTAQAFWDRVEYDLFQAAMTNRSAALVVLDVQDLKQVNHLRGHRMGDHLIAQFGAILQNFATASYLVGRIGGDVFGLWTQYRDAAVIRRDLESLEAMVKQSRNLGAFSYGLAILGEHGTTVDALFSHADADLYRERRRTVRNDPPQNRRHR